MAGYISGILHILDLIKENKNEGMMIPDDLDHHKLWNYSKMFLGDFLFTQLDFKLTIDNKDFSSKNIETNNWQFKNFLIDSL